MDERIRANVMHTAGGLSYVADDSAYTFHYPPELFSLLVQTIPLLGRSKKDVLLFFRGAGVRSSILGDLEAKVQADRSSISKAAIVRSVLERLNSQPGDTALRERREVLRRVVEFENVTACWPEDQLAVRGLIAEVQKVVNVKDSFTRMAREREREAELRRAESRRKTEAENKRRGEIRRVGRELASLFGMTDGQKRGKLLEGVLNQLFAVHGLSVREAFERRDPETGRTVEQVDGVVEVDGNVYLVEMKWWKDRLGKGDVSNHLVNVFNRGHARGMLISASSYTDGAIAVCRDSLAKTTVVLWDLEEIVLLLEKEGDFVGVLKQKIVAAIAGLNPYFRGYDVE